LIANTYSHFCILRDAIFNAGEIVMKTFVSITFLLILLISNGCEKQEVPVPDIDLHTAVLTDDLDVICQHVKAGSDLNVPESSLSSSPLITAAALGRTDAAEILIDGGADLNYKNDDGSTALITAIAFGKTEVAEILIDAGADLDTKNNEGSSALHTAAFFCNVEIVEALLENGIDKSIRNKNLATAMEIVERPFEEVKAVYDHIGKKLYELGITLDYDHIKKTRPIIADMLK
jgi:ankyrin repeat protein